MNAYGWEQGRNHGNLRKMLPPLEEHISSLVQKRSSDFDRWSLEEF